MSERSTTPPNTTSTTEETPVTPPRPRVLCPGCSEELVIHETLGTGAALIYANEVDMAKLGLQCHTNTCDMYIKGPAKLDPKLDRKSTANSNIAKYVQMAKKEHDEIEAAKQQSKQQALEDAEKRKREQEAAEYAKYDPFSGSAAEKAMNAAREQEAARIQQRLAEDQQLVADQWGRLMDGVRAGIKVKDEEEEARRSGKE